MVRVPNWVRQVSAGVTTEEVQRFDGALDAIETELERRPGTDNDPWFGAARNDIANARMRREKYKLEAAWSALNSARREMIRSFDPTELVAHARVVRNEADDKLTGWRHRAAAELLPAELVDNVNLGSGGLTVERRIRVSDTADARPVQEQPGAGGSLVDDLRTRLIDTRRLLDANTDNQYHKYRILRRAVISTTVVYLAFLVVLVAIVALGWVPNRLLADPPGNSPLGSWRLLVVVMMLGIIGAFFSSATELRGGDDAPSIPDLRVRYTLMVMRPVVGAAGAVVVIVVLQSAFGDAVALQPTAIFGVAIAAGFTERLVTKTVSSAANAIG